MQIIQMNPNELKPYKNNAKKHSDSQIKKIANSIEHFGFLNPILIDKDNNILCGHARQKASLLLNFKQVPCLRVEHLSEAQKKAYILADNRLAEIDLDYDLDLLNVELDYLKEYDFDVSLTGWDEEIKDDKESKEKDKIESSIDNKYLLMIDCKDENEQQMLFDEFNQRNLKVKIP